MKNKSPKPVSKTSNKQTNGSGHGFVPPAYGINFVDKQNNSNDAAVQGVFESSPEEVVSVELSDKISKANPSKFLPNNTGLPDNLKTGIENLSGFSMDEVQVHYNSSRPAQLDALAYTQGTEIHVAPGQEMHLPHEAWHVVQQKQGRVQPTMQMKEGVPVNDDAGLEHEADVMGARASQMTQEQKARPVPAVTNHAAGHLITQLRGLKNVGKSTLKNFGSAMKIDAFKNGIAKFYDAPGGASRVDYLASQLFSEEGEDFESLNQFLIELAYDLETKSLKYGSTKSPLKNEELTLQEHYMTEYGWKRAAKAARPKIQGQKLKLYRTMDVADWKKLAAGDYSVLQGAHLGDFKQSLKYFLGESKDPKVMVEFTLKEGGERALFSPALALPKANERTAKLKVMATAMGNGQFPVCTTNEGTSSEAIGIKSESEGEAGFSIGIGGGNTAKTFMALVETIALKSVGENFIKYKGTGEDKGTSQGKDEDIEKDAKSLLGVNNCLINAIALAALDREATLPELTAIRGAMNNYGEMLLASPAVVGLIRRVLNIVVPITVNYQGNTPAEDYPGQGQPVHIYHVNGNHFTHEFQE